MMIKGELQGFPFPFPPDQREIDSILGASRSGGQRNTSKSRSTTLGRPSLGQGNRLPTIPKVADWIEPVPQKEESKKGTSLSAGRPAPSSSAERNLERSWWSASWRFCGMWWSSQPPGHGLTRTRCKAGAWLSPAPSQWNPKKAPERRLLRECRFFGVSCSSVGGKPWTAEGP